MIVTFYNSVNMRFGGGGERWLFEVSKSLSQRGHEVNVISLKYTPEVNWPDFGCGDYFRYFELPYVKLPRGNPFPSLSSVGDVVEQFNSSDVVYFYVNAPNELFLKLFRSRLRSPVIGGFHTFMRHEMALQRLYIPFMKYSLKVFDAFHVLNSYLLHMLEAWEYKNVYYVPNGVDTSAFKLCTHPGNSRTFNVFFAGRLSEEKGADILCRIIRHLNTDKWKSRNFKFVVAGNGSLSFLVESLVRDYDDVDYLGFVSRHLMPEIYGGAHLLLAPSRVEGMPLGVLEAQSCGLPVVASHVAGISDVVLNGETGQLLKVGDVEGFAKAIELFYEMWKESPEEYYDMNKQIRSHVVKNYEWNMTMDKFEHMLESTLQGT